MYLIPFAILDYQRGTCNLIIISLTCQLSFEFLVHFLLYKYQDEMMIHSNQCLSNYYFLFS